MAQAWRVRLLDGTTVRGCHKTQWASAEKGPVSEEFLPDGRAMCRTDVRISTFSLARTARTRSRKSLDYFGLVDHSIALRSQVNRSHGEQWEL